MNCECDGGEWEFRFVCKKCGLEVSQKETLKYLELAKREVKKLEKKHYA